MGAARVTYAGFKIALDPSMLDEDWSRVRSRGRARRRRDRGFRQNIRFSPKKLAYQIGPDKLVMHPAMYAELKRAVG